MLKKILLFLIVSTLGLQFCYASSATPPDEGMWLPMFVKRLNYTDMKKMGLKLTPEEIYSINNSSLKDAIVMLGEGFCTAEVISNQGLLLTNHHCAYDGIQSLSSIENDYLTNGFWAKDKKAEMPIEGLTASFLVRMEDVTQQVLAGVNDNTSMEERQALTGKAIEAIESKASEAGKYTASVKPFFAGNEYYLFVYETFEDVRFVGAPPEAIGKYGGETDNWMWPRHTGDFAMLRVYMGKDGKSNSYAPENVPLKPKHHLPISLGGVKKNDFAMVMGYPGSTDRYLPSYGVKLLIDESNPKRVEIRDKKLQLLKQDMEADPKVRLMYASKYATVSNYWKYFIGQTRGLKRLHVYEQKQEEEKRFQAWANVSEERKKKYGNVLKNLEEGYTTMRESNLFYIHVVESVFGIEILPYAWSHAELTQILQLGNDTEEAKEMIAELRELAKNHFKDYNVDTDKKVFQHLLQMSYDDLDKEQHPDIFKIVENDFEGSFEKFTEAVFSQSIFASQDKINAFLDNPSIATIANDPAFQVVSSFLQVYFLKVIPTRQASETKIAESNRLLIDGLRKMNSNKKYYPNANSTLRLTYGQVLDYFPEDAVLYSYYTTAQGILEKEDPNEAEFNVPAKLKSAILKKDFGRYGQDGKLRVAFITNNDITGGNSGSPVMNAKGQLIGLAFDGNWEAMSGDIAFETNLQRCINVDIRYVLFIVEKVGGAKHIVDEMTLVEGSSKSTKDFKELVPKKY